MSKGKGSLMKEPTCDVQCDHSRGEQNRSEAPHCLCGMCKMCHCLLTTESRRSGIPSQLTTVLHFLDVSSVIFR